MEFDQTSLLTEAIFMADIVDTAINAGTFNTLATAITTAGMDTALKGPGPFTVFAPTDEAFSKLPSGTVESLLEDILQLRKVLEYHVVPGKFMAADVVKLDSATTTEGSTVKIDASNGVKVNDATVVTPDVEADNGVIHVIDTVLIPQ
ncbi:Sensory subunit of low CO2-induced protein complex, putative [uncultured Coleofasciculus sp.]|uniref:Sensory subunit of low CO2-induced protein complex, putative n=1 Tax=uncultured Coleofasciculus sp. TaxID=1267456 RepID=A0A6J4KL44_9CYAN|nr:Sensory subunit of low CO2-induced protein complex, putative [uncultured Coleofasciculus sp.]